MQPLKLPMSDLVADLQLAFRNLGRRPGFTALALLILVLGIGANAAIFSCVDGVMLRPFPYPEPDRVVSVAEKSPHDERVPISTLTYLDWEKQNTVFEALAADTGGQFSLTTGQDLIPLVVERVRARSFDIYQASTFLGRTFLPDEDQPGHDHVVVLSYFFWASQFASDPHLVGQTISLNHEPYTVVGILPPNSAYDRSRVQIWVPLTLDNANRSRDYHWLWARARLKTGVTIEQARAEMSAIAARMAHDYPDSHAGWGVSIIPLSQYVISPEVRDSLYLLLATVSIILLIACANLANLSLAQGLARQREVAIRASLGASRGRIIRQFLTENILLCAIGGLLGVGLAFALVQGFQKFIPPDTLPAEADIRIDARVLAFTLVISVVTGVLSGLAPALHSTRLDLAGAIKQSGPNASTDRQGRRLRSFLVVIEVALAFILLTGAGLLLRSLSHLREVYVARDPSRLISGFFKVPPVQAPNETQLLAYLHQIESRVRVLPGVAGAALTDSAPLYGYDRNMYFQIAGHPEVSRAQRSYSGYKIVSPTYFVTVGMQVVQGRFFTEGDHAGGLPVMLVNERWVKKYLPGENPLGRVVRIQKIGLNDNLGDDIPWHIVGVVSGERNNDLSDHYPDEGVYVPLEQSPVLEMGIVVRSSSDPALVEHAIPHAVQTVNPDQVVYFMQTIAERKIELMGIDRLRSNLIVIFAGLALTLSIVGIYGVLSCSVTQRTREIGIRIALGSSNAGILSLTLREGMALVGIGLGLGLVGALSLGHLLAAWLVGVGGHDPATMGVVAGILAAAGFLACYLPAQRAVRVSPLVALQSE
jgi:putative ABC transport system permease protein